MTAGEAVEPELRSWIQTTFGTLGAEVLDGWGQVMIGGIAQVHGGTTQLPDMGPRVIDEAGQLCRSSGTGELVLTHPLPGMVTSVEGPDAEVMLANYNRRGPNTYSTSDMVTVTGDTWVHHGRSDSLASMAGQLISLNAVRRVILDHPFVRRAEATTLLDSAGKKSIIAAVELQTDDGGTSEASNNLDPGPAAGAPAFSVRASEIAEEIIDSVHDVLGGLATPRTVIFVDMLPKNSRTILGSMDAGLLPADTQAAHLTWKEISDQVRA